MAKSRAAKISLVVAVVAVLGAVVFQFGPRLLFSQFGYMALGNEESQIPPKQTAAIAAMLGSAKARVVWSSSRSGSHEIYLMDLPAMSITQLTDNKFVDYFPHFSPSGKRIVFARSQKAWVSQRNYAPWDVWVLDLQTGQERMVAPGGNFPQWAGPDSIIYTKGRKVFTKELSTGYETLILDGAKDPVDAAISTPEMSLANPDLLAFTARGKMNGVYVLHLSSGKFIKYAKGACELTWFPDGERVAWIGGGGKGKTRVLTSPLTPVKISQLIDLPGDYSHEYFPRISPDGRWLIWGASAKGHEHDIADYELFLWPIGQPAKTAQRLTFNPANDRWPDIFIDR